MRALSPGILWRAMTPGDRVAAAAVLLLSLAPLLLQARAGGAGPARAVVLRGGEKVAVLPLDRPGVFPVEGRLGRMLLEVGGGAVRVRESPCPQQICRAMGAKRRPGEILACVPAAIVVRIEGGASVPGAVPDAVSR